MNVISLSCDVKMQRVFGWVSILWFTSGVTVTASLGLELHTISQVAARCGENVTLTCEVSSTSPLVIKSFSWMHKNRSVCKYNPDQKESSDSPCAASIGPHLSNYSLTLYNVMPGDDGHHLCKVQTTAGTKHGNTMVKVQDCLERKRGSVSMSHASCWFSGVYPDGEVHWSQGGVNLTGSAIVEKKQDSHGRFNISSQIKVQNGKQKLQYNCSLWMPSTGKLLSSQTVPLVLELGSSGHVVRVQWGCLVVLIMTVMMFCC